MHNYIILSAYDYITYTNSNTLITYYHREIVDIYSYESYLYNINLFSEILQTLFNPNESVVKVFVILYDVTDMPPAHRTFLRHRIYSKPVATPVLDHNNNSDGLEPVPDSIMQDTRTNSTCLRYFVNLW